MIDLGAILVVNMLVISFLCWRLWSERNIGVVKTVSIKNPHKWTDVEKEMVEVVDKNGKIVTLAFTDGGFAEAKTHGNRLKELVESGRTKIL